MVSAHVGLRENEGKVKVVPRKKAWQQQLLDAGFSAHHVVASTRVLGIDFHARLGGWDKQTQDSRLTAANHRLKCIAFLPVSLNRKAGLVSSLPCTFLHLG
jgi:hypothetical protein